MRWQIFVPVLWAALACGETENADDHDAGGDEGGGGVAGATGLGGTAGSTGGAGGFGGAGATGGSSGSDDAGEDAGVDSGTDAAPVGDAADSGDGGEICLKACDMFLVLNCAGGPNTSAECVQACAALAKKGAACKTHTDEMYGCMLAAGPQSIACGTYGAQPKCGFCDALVADLSKYCGFSTPCVP